MVAAVGFVLWRGATIPMTDYRISPVPKKEGDSLADYVEYFGRVCSSNDWDDATAAKIFPGLLDIKCKAVNDLDEETRKSFKKIVRQLGPAEESYRDAKVQEFFFLSMKEGKV